MKELIRISLFLILSGMIALFSCTEKEMTRPNILFAIMDDATWEHMGAYGCEWVKTPGFDRVANEGILFMNAYTPNAKCAPSRAVILTGRNSWQLEEAANHWCFFPDKFKTFPEVLNENGYHTGYTTKGWAPGVVGEINGKKRLLTGKAYNEKKLIPPTDHISTSDYAANFVDFLDDKDTDKPFCFWYGSIEPHRAYEFGSGNRLGGKTPDQINEVYPFWPDNDSVRNDLLDYAFEIEYFDKHLQRMISELEKREMLDNTLIIVTADNGMPFPRIKGQKYEYSNHLPLAVMWPEGIKHKNRKVEDYISFIDFAPTVLELAGIDEELSGMQKITGRSLTDIFFSDMEGQVNLRRDHLLIGKERHDIGRPDDQGYPVRGIVKASYLLLQNFKNERWPSGNPETGYLNCDGSPTKTVCLDAANSDQSFRYWELSFGKRPVFELYDIEKDPACIHNLAQDKQFETVMTELRDQLHTKLKDQGDPRIFGNGDLFDNYMYANPNGRDFYNRFKRGEDMNAGWVNKSDFREAPPQK